MPQASHAQDAANTVTAFLVPRRILAELAGAPAGRPALASPRWPREGVVARSEVCGFWRVYRHRSLMMISNFASRQASLIYDITAFSF